MINRELALFTIPAYISKALSALPLELDPFPDIKLASSSMAQITDIPIASLLRDPYAKVTPSGNTKIESRCFLLGKCSKKYGDLSTNDRNSPYPVLTACVLFTEKYKNIIFVLLIK